MKDFTEGSQRGQICKVMLALLAKKGFSIEPTSSKKRCSPCKSVLQYFYFKWKYHRRDGWLTKTCGVVGDGAFMKGNETFKKTMKELFSNEEFQFRWDLLHLQEQLVMWKMSKHNKSSSKKGCRSRGQNYKNKQHFLDMLGDHLSNAGCSIHPSIGDECCLIVQKAISSGCWWHSLHMAHWNNSCLLLLQNPL